MRRAAPMNRLLLVALLLVGCDATVEDRLRACGFASEGSLPALPLYDDACYRACFAGASCEALDAALCRTDVSLLIECDQQCAPRCDDGALIAPHQVCNGFSDCADDSDEQGCTPYVCADGQELGSRRPRCDGWPDCADESDEEGCPRIVCGDGTELRPSHRCDGYEACADGADEAGCATLTLSCR